MLDRLDDAIAWHWNLDESGRSNFKEWQAKHPYGLLKDWWDLQAYKNSGYVLPNPLDNPEVVERLRRK